MVKKKNKSGIAAAVNQQKAINHNAASGSSVNVQFMGGDMFEGQGQGRRREVVSSQPFSFLLLLYPLPTYSWEPGEALGRV